MELKLPYVSQIDALLFLSVEWIRNLLDKIKILGSNNTTTLVVAIIIFAIILFGLGFAIDYLVGHYTNWSVFFKSFKYYLPVLYLLCWASVYFLNW